MEGVRQDRFWDDEVRSKQFTLRPGRTEEGAEEKAQYILDGLKRYRTCFTVSLATEFHLF
jgi:hypothetical protein